MNPVDVKQLVLSSAQEKNGVKKLPCTKAFALSQEHGVPLRRIGDICNEAGVRICHCQLGCFD